MKRFRVTIRSIPLVCHVDSIAYIAVNGGSGGESCSIRLWEREACVLEGVRTSPNGEVRESKHAVEPGANNTGPCGRSHGRQLLYSYQSN
jgi:hypothetical protein